MDGSMPSSPEDKNPFEAILEEQFRTRMLAVVEEAEVFRDKTIQTLREKPVGAFKNELSGRISTALGRDSQ